MAILGEVAPLALPAEGTFSLSETLPLVDAVIDIICRHPMRETELVETLHCLGRRPDQVQATLEALEAGGQARRRVYRGQVFWEYAGSGL